MGDILKLKNQEENLLKNSSEKVQLNNDNQSGKQMNKQYEILLSDLKQLEDSAKKNIIEESTKVNNALQNISNVLYVKTKEKRVSEFNQKSNRLENVIKTENKRHTVMSSSKSKEKNKRNKSFTDEAVSDLEKKTLSAKEENNSDDPIYLRHARNESSPQSISHIQRVRDNKRDSTPQLRTDPNHEHNMILTTGIINTDHTNKTANNEMSLMKTGNILEGVKTNRTFHLLRNKRIQNLMESNLIVTIDSIGGEHCCKRLKKNYDMNISVSSMKIQQQQQELSRITSHNKDGISSPSKSKTYSLSPIQTQRSKFFQNEKSRKEAKSIEKFGNSSIKSGKNNSSKQPRENRNINETNQKQGNIILTNPENLITFNNDVHSSNNDKKTNNLSKYVNTQGSHSKSNLLLSQKRNRTTLMNNSYW
jgi:hypothetical protein